MTGRKRGTAPPEIEFFLTYDDGYAHCFGASARAEPS